MRLRRAWSRWMMGCVLSPIVVGLGCGDADTKKATGEFRRASGLLAVTYEQFVLAGNEVEQADYLAGLETTPGVYREREVKSNYVFTPEQIALRGSAIKALGAYTATLAELASGKAAGDLEADAKAASANLGTLDKDVQAAAATKHFGVKPELFEGPATAALTAAGAVLKLIEERRGQAAIRKSVLDNDKAIAALFAQISDEASGLYERQRSTVGAERVAVLNAFNDEARGRGAVTTPDKVKMIYLADKLQRIERATVMQRAANPQPAIDAFKESHAALVAAVRSKKGDKRTLQELLSDAKSFADEVGPAASDIQTFALSF